VKRRQQWKLPDLGGTVTIAIVETHAPIQASPGPARSSKARVIARLQQKSKLGDATPSDEVEGLTFEIRWEPAKGALGVAIPMNESLLAAEVLFVVRLQPS
jgi:mediator of RNA polymerase II transcription subunit 14